MTDNTTGFSEFELAAMKERAAELRAQKGGKKKADNLQAALDKIAELSGDEQEVAVTLHQIVGDVAPDLEARTWYGMPAYARDGAVLVFLQPGSKFETRYSTVGFNDNAALDDGDMWPASFAVTRTTDEVKARLTELVTHAVS